MKHKFYKIKAHNAFRKTNNLAPQCTGVKSTIRHRTDLYSSLSNFFGDRCELTAPFASLNDFGEENFVPQGYHETLRPFSDTGLDGPGKIKSGMWLFVLLWLGWRRLCSWNRMVEGVRRTKNFGDHNRFGIWRGRIIGFYTVGAFIGSTCRH